MSPTPQIYPQLHLVQYIIVIVSDSYRHLGSNGTIPVTIPLCIQLVNTGNFGKPFYFYDNLMSPYNYPLNLEYNTEGTTVSETNKGIKLVLEVSHD